MCVLLLSLIVCFSQTLIQADEFSPGCSGIIQDVVFLLDTTESISKINSQLSQQFITQMIKFIKSSKDQNRIALVEFGDSAGIVFDFTKHSSIDGMIKDLEAINYQNRFTAIGKAFNLTFEELLPTMRKDADKLIILLTDGTTTKYPLPYSYAYELKNAGVNILTIGIGSDTNNMELKTLATPGLSVAFDSFTELLNSQNQIISYMCPILDCKNTKLDLVIALQSSYLMDDEMYDNARRFLAKLFEELYLGPDNVRVTMISFSDKLRTDFKFGELYDLPGLIDKLRDLDKLRKFARYADFSVPLKEIQLNLKPQQRSGVPFTILLITDGEYIFIPLPLELADSLKADGANIILTTLKSNEDMEEFYPLTSNGKVLTIDSFNELEKSLKTVFKNGFCNSLNKSSAGLRF